MSIHHIAVGLSFINRTLKSDELVGKPQSILIDNLDKPLSYEAAYREIQRRRDAGQRVWPPCDKTGPDGGCLGHEKLD